MQKEGKEKFQVFGESKNSNYSASLPFSLNLFRTEEGGKFLEIKTNFPPVVTGMIIFLPRGLLDIQEPIFIVMSIPPRQKKMEKE